MSLLSVAQGESGYSIASNLDTAATEFTRVTGSTATNLAFGTLTQSSDSLTGNASYIFGSNARVQYSGVGYSGGVSNFIQEFIFKKPSKPASGDAAYLAAMPTQQVGGYVNSVYIDSSGYVTALVKGAYTTTSLTAGVDVCDNKWHHVVVQYGNGSNEFRIYVDGTLISYNTTIGNSTWYGVWNLGSYLGQDFSTTSAYFNGTIDFAAFYLGQYTATQMDTFVANHRATFANKVIAAAVSTASALMPSSTTTTTKVVSYSAAPMTASSTFTDTVVATRDGFTLLDTYMSGLALEQYYKFDEDGTINNYGNGGNAGYIFTGNVRNDISSGIQGEGALRFTGQAALGTTFTVTDANLNSEITDNDFSLGFWVKKSTTEGAMIFSTNDEAGQYVNVEFTSSGYIVANAHLNNQDHVITTSTAYTNGQWHYVAVRMSGTTMQLWVDNVSKGTVTVNHSFADMLHLDFGTGAGSATELMYVSQFYIAPSSVVTSTQIANIWNYGYNQIIQAGAAMPMPKFSRDNALNQYILAKSPVLYFKMDEASGLPLNSGYVSTTPTIIGTNYSQDISSPNYKAYSLSNRDTQITGAWTAPSQTFSNYNRQTILFYTKFGSGIQNGLGGAASFGDVAGNGLVFQVLATGALRLRTNDAAGFDTLSTSATFADDNYHMVIGVKDNADMKIYVDGIEQASMSTAAINLTDYGQFAIGGLPTAIPTSSSRTLFVDEFAVFNTAFSAQDAFEAHQKIAFVQDTTANALMVQPTTSLGYGPTINPGVGYATALLVDPTQQDTINMLPTPMTAFAEPRHPNYVATVFIESYYNASPMTSSALFHMPQYNIGEINSSDTMTASALMGNATFTTPGLIQVNPMIGSAAAFVMPGIVTIRGARIFAETLTANAFAPLPPAYFQLSDDPYYIRLFNQHATISEERVFQGASNVVGANPLRPKTSFLAFFNDISQDIPLGTTRYISSVLPAYVFDRPGTVYYDSNGTIYPAPTNKEVIQAAGKSTATPTPLLSKGYYDPYQRPAVRVNNIEFSFPETTYITEKPYTLEFTIRTTKANQVIAKGRWESYYANQWHTGTIGLYNGKLYGMATFQNIGQNEVIPHPLNSSVLLKAGLSNGYMLSDVRLDDGKWHHVIVQYGYEGDGRAQFWIDGELDKQIIDGYGTPGYNGRMNIRPYILGNSSIEANFQSDFETSVWSYDPAGFVSFGDAKLNYIAYTKSIPINVAPMLADSTITQDTVATGNRTRALMLYFWPEGANIATSSYARQVRGYNEGWGGAYDIPTLEGFSTNDYYRTPPEQWLEWDIFPVDVTGKYLSDVIKPEAYGGEENAVLQSPSVALSGEIYDPLKYERKINSRGYFRDDNDDFRYINLVKDIDLSKFDVIMFKNFPDDSIEQDAFSKNAEVDRYLSLTTRTLYEGFIKSVREAVDTGISLLVTNPQLAIDLEIVDRLEPLPYQEQSQDDPFVQEYERSLLPETAPNIDSTGNYPDSHYMSKIRLVTQVEGMTDYPVGIRTDKSYFQNDGLRDFTGTDLTWQRVEYRPNGIQVNDEFEVMVQETGTYPPRSAILWSAPFENVKAGTIVTAWQKQIRQGQTLVDNKFANYASSIIVKPGDVLAGKQCGGKIFVDLMHARLKDSPDYASIDLDKIYWIDIAEKVGAITASQATELRNSPETLDNKYPNQSLPEYTKRVYWTHNDGDYSVLGGEQVTLNKALNLGQVALAGKRAKNSSKGNNKVIDSAFGMFTGGGQLWFNIRYSYVMDTFALWTPTISSLGILWLSQRTSIPGQVTNHTAQTAVADIIHPNVVVDKIASINAQSMVAVGMITNAVGKAPTAASIAPLPMTANAILSGAARIFYAAPMIAIAKVPTNFQTVTYSVDEVIVYLNHVDPILYLREDIIK